MSDSNSEISKPLDTIAVDIWKFFEERGDTLKESMFKILTWIVGVASALLAFAIKDGFEKGLLKTTQPAMVIGLSIAGLFVLFLATAVIFDNAAHLNRTFARANAVRDGETSLQKIWNAGKRAEQVRLPGICKYFIDNG